MKLLKRTLAMLLVLTMVLGMVPFAAFAEETTEGTEGTLPAPTHMATKPADGTVTGQPFKDDASVSRNYRIPGLVNHNGTLIATADVRYNAEKDGGGIDIVVSQSKDGNTWNYTFPAYLGDNGNEYNGASSTIMDPLIISDGETLYLLYDLFSAGYSLGTWNTTYGFWATGTGFDSQGRLRLGTTYNGAEDSWNYYLENGQIKDSSGKAVAGYTVDAWFNVYQNGTYVSNLFFKDSPYMVYPTSYIAMQKSTDGGSNWSDPQLLNIKENGPTWEVLGPGTGLVTAKGELAFTTYDNTNIYLIHGKDNDWSIVKTPSATNESSIVELADGTIRAFVKNNSKTISYVDFTPNGDSYTAGAAKSTGIPNTGWCMVSSLVYSRSIDGEDVILVCCPKGSDDDTRRFGTLHAFKADSMELVGSYQIDTGYTDQFFAYSDMAELDNGKLALIYEDGCGNYKDAPWNNKPAGIGYSHISYTEIDLETALDVEFDVDYDVFVWNADNSAGEVGVPTTAGVNHVNVRPATVDGMTMDYDAYDMVLCKDEEDGCAGFGCANVHTGSAMVTLALTESLKAADDVKGFVVKDDGSITSVLDVENDGEYVTFEAPHFSVVGIAAMTDDEIAEKNGVDVTLKVGETKTFPIDGMAYTDDDVTKAENADTVVLTQVVGNTVVNRELVAATEIKSGAKYMIISDRTGGDGYGGQYGNYYVTNKEVTSAKGAAGLELAAASSDSAIWIITATEDGYYTISDGTENINIQANNNVTLDPDAVVQIRQSTYKTGCWEILSTAGVHLNYFNSFQTNTKGAASAWKGDNDPGSQWQLYELIEETVPSTEITFTGKKVGQTQVTVGATKYTITVEPAAVENLTIQIGENKTFTVDGVAYTDDDVIKAENADTVVLTSVEGNSVAHREVSTVPATEIKSGAKYVIVSAATPEREMIANTGTLTNGNLGLELAVRSATNNVAANAIWTITANDDGTYTVSNGGLNVAIKGNHMATLEENAVVQIKNGKNGTDDWLIYANVDGTDYCLNDHNSFDAAFSHGSAMSAFTNLNGDRSQLKLYEVIEETESSTEITFTGEAEGKTQVTVGATQYNITVVPLDVRNITLHIGATETFTIEGYTYSMANATTKPNMAYATLKSVKAVPTLVPVTAIESGKQYLIVNKSTGDVLTDTVVSASGTWGARTGLDTTGKASANSAELWTITGADGSYTVAQNGKYLVVAGFHADMSADAANLTLAYTESGWTIYDNTTYQALVGHDGPGYYLSDKVDEANGYAYDAMGSSDEGNAARYWDIYEIDPQGATEVVFTGIAKGDTTAVIGHVTFNITVVEPDPVELDITLYKDVTATYVIEGLAYGDANVKLYPEATAAKLDSVTSKVIPAVKRLVQITSENQIVSGKSYLIATRNNNSVLTSEAQTATALNIGSVASVNSTELWTFTGGNGVYTISPAENSYLNLAHATGATVTNTAQSLTVEWLQNASAWTIAGTGTNKYLNNYANTNDLAATWSDNDAGSQWHLFEIVTEEPDRTITEVTFTGVTPGETTTAQVGHVTYNITVEAPVIRPITLYVGVTQNDFIEGFGYNNTHSTQPDNNTYAYIHSVTTENGDTKVVFSGVAKTPKGKVSTATVGHVIYHITVEDLHSGEDVPGFNCVIGEGEYESGDGVIENLNGKEVKSLRISEGMEFNLGVDIEITDDVSIEWVNTNPDIATVDETGKITAVSEGTTLIKATVTKNGVSETMAVHVTVVPSMVEGYSADEICHVVYYIDTVHMTDPFYTMFLSSENTTGPVAEHTMVMVSQGEVIVLQRPKEAAFGMVWTSDPWDGHALTYMAATGTQGDYFPLQSKSGALETGTVNGIEYYKGSQAYKNIINSGNNVGASWKDAFDALLEYNVRVGEDIWLEFGCDGAMSMSRGPSNEHPNAATSLSFISEKLPEVSKTVNGILPASGNRSDWQLYQEGMYASVGQHVYFTLSVTQDAPRSWQLNEDGSFKYATDEDGNVLLDAEGNKLKLSALVFQGTANLVDRLMRPVKDENGNTTYEPITQMANPPYFYTKELDIQDGDQVDNGDGDAAGNIDGFIVNEALKKNSQDIVNDLNKGWTAEEIAAGQRTLEYYVVYTIQETDNNTLLVNGAGLSYEYSSAYSAGESTKTGTADAKLYVLGASLGDVVVDFGLPVTIDGLTSKHMADRFDEVNTNKAIDGAMYGHVDIDQKEDGTYSVTYTPDTILQGYDVVYLMDKYNNLLNYFRVYPATTVYYEEDFLMKNSSGWTIEGEANGTNQEHEILGERENVYGYDPVYDNGVGASLGTYASATQFGASTSFTFTGTGFDLYANCTMDSGYVAAMIKNASGSLVKMYTINTSIKDETVRGEDENFDEEYHLPIVSKLDLPYGTYTVEVRKLVSDTKVVKLDGVRVYNTLENSSPFVSDKEDNPAFYELRDYVLNCYELEDGTKLEDSDRYGSLAEMCDQIYTAITDGGVAPVAMLSAIKVYGQDTNIQDMLDNGPKNELFLYANQSLTFKVNTSRIMQLGLKAPTGAPATYQIQVNGATVKEGTMNTSVDMFYNLNDPTSVNIANQATTITATGGKENSDEGSANLVDGNNSSLYKFYDAKMTDEQSVILTYEKARNMNAMAIAFENVGATDGDNYAFTYSILARNGSGEYDTIVDHATANRTNKSAQSYSFPEKTYSEVKIVMHSCKSGENNGWPAIAEFEVYSGVEHTVTVTNTGDAILSVTKLKICDDPNAKFAPLTVEDIEQILLAAGYPADEEAPVEPSAPEESKPQETTPEETKPEESKPADTTPEETTPEETKPAETTPEETKPADTGCAKDETCVLSKYSDIVTTEWYHDGVHFCVTEGLMNGMGEGIFAPNDPTTRAQLVTMLYRLMGNPKAEGKTEPFTDVAEGEWYYDAIVWAYSENVVKGISETEFAPNANVTREQVATILHRFLATPEGTGKLDSFSDAAFVSDYAKDALVWAVGEGLINGVAQTNGKVLLDPTGTATRAQIATILYRYLENA